MTEERADRDARVQNPPADLRARLAIALAFAVTLVMKIGDSDVWWHIRTGQWIAEHRAIPTTDPFSHTFAGQPWRYTEWLAQLLYAGVHHVGGAGALVGVHAAIGATIALVAATLARAKAGPTMLAVGLAGAASHAAMTLKPQAFSYLAVALLALVVDRAPRSPRLLLALPPLFLAWASLHRGGVLGLALLGAASLVWLARDATRSLGARALGVTAASAVALLANPGGLFYFTSAFDVASRASFREHIAEWQPMSLDILVAHHLALVPLLALAIAERTRASQRRVDPELLFVLVTALLAARSARLVPFLAITLVPPAARATEAGLAALGARLKSSVRSSILEGAIGTLGPVALAAHALHAVPAPYWGPGVMDGRVPVALATFLHDDPPPGRMWHSFDFGGYFLYALAPEVPVFIDGRNDTLYTDAFFEESLEAEGSPAGLAAQLDRYEIGFVVVAWRSPEDPGAPWLHADPSWQLVYWDDLGAVLVRRTPESAAYLARHGYEALRVDTAFERSELPELPDDARYVEELVQNAAHAPRSVRAAWLAAHALRIRGLDAGPLVARARALALERDLALPDP